MSRIASVVVPLLLLVFVGGCSCWKNPLAKTPAKAKQPQTLEEMEQRRKELEEKKEEKPDFETTRLTVLPSDDTPSKNLVKPGHWFNAVQTTKANNFDFPKGDLEARCVDRWGNPVPLPGTNLDLRTTRPVSLPKGEQKHFDVLVFANKPGKGPINFQTQLRPRGGGREMDMKWEPTTTMKPYQYYAVVLAEFSDNYQFVKSLRSVKPVRPNDDFGSSADVDYFVKLPKGTRRVDLPTHPLTWTNIAYVIWDDFNPSIMSTTQQQAMIDWLHWGGQLIISGPRTLDLMANSSFAAYLPARAGAGGELTDEAIAQLNEHWSFEDKDANRLEFDDSQRPLTIELELAKDASYVSNTADLVAKRSVGRGRIVVTAFAIPHETFLAWDSYDSFFNSALMGRPARTFRLSGEMVHDHWGIQQLARDDPRVNSQVRYFSRDAMGITHARHSDRRTTARTQGATANVYDLSVERSGPPPTVAEAEADPDLELDGDEDLSITEVARYSFGVAGFANDKIVGVGGWNDQSDVSQAASDSLFQSAGISVPSISFIARVLSLYLVVLVPLNWILFRLMGRVEWAWAAVPLIAIGGALTVVRVAQLDIGFARSRTEISVVETQPGYQRAHLTRYVGLYSSLSSRYTMTGDDESTLLQPLASAQQRVDPHVTLYQGTNVSLTGFGVLSNSTGLVHAEQMFDLGGTIRLSVAGGIESLSNQTDHGLNDAAVVRRTLDDDLEVAWVGELASKSESRLTFEPLRTSVVEFPAWEESPATSSNAVEGDLNMRDIMDIAMDPRRLGLGEAVLVGWNDTVMPGLTVKPSAAQTTARTVFVSQLRHAARPAVARDDNQFAGYMRQQRINKNRTEQLE